MIRRLALLSMVLGILGCGGGSTPLAAPVKTTGKVVDAAGKPVSNVTLNLQPLENGYTQLLELKSDGSFSIETQSGKYAYFFSPKSGSKQLPAQLNKYVEANMQRTVQIENGKEVEIRLE